MSFQELADWLEVAHLQDYTPQQVGSALLAGLDDVELFGPEFEAELLELHALCEAGRVPELEISTLPMRYKAPRPPVPDGIRLERELRDLAASLPESEWRIGYYRQFEAAVARAQQGQLEPLEEAIDALREVLVEAWHPYLNMQISGAEIAAESVVGHRLLVEGFHGWTEGLDLLDRAIEGEIPFAQGMARAEIANRLLMAVQILARRTESST